MVLPFHKLVGRVSGRVHGQKQRGSEVGYACELRVSFIMCFITSVQVTAFVWKFWHVMRHFGRRYQVKTVNHSILLQLWESKCKVCPKKSRTGLEGGLSGKNIYCLCRGPESFSQDPYGIALPLSPGGFDASSLLGHLRSCAHTLTHIHIIKSKKNLKNKLKYVIVLFFFAFSQDLSHATIEMYTSIGRIRSAKLVGKDLAEFYM